MKKLIALVLAIVMLAAVSIPVFAEDLPTPQEHYGANNSLDYQNPKGDVEVHYEVKSNYEVCIPEDVIFVDTYGFKFTADVIAKNVIIGKNQTLTVNLTSKNGFKMMPEAGKEGNADGVLYTVGYVQNDKLESFEWPAGTLGDNSDMSTKLTDKFNAASKDYTEAAANVENPVVVVKGGSKQTVGTTMMFFLPQQETILGHYIDTLTFEVKLDGKVNV